jgi:hypothetical protein
MEILARNQLSGLQQHSAGLRSLNFTTTESSYLTLSTYAEEVRQAQICDVDLAEEHCLQVVRQ